MIKKIKYLLVFNVLSFLLINTFANSDSHNISELLQIIQKDLKTLEKAVYSNSSSNDLNLSSSSMDQNSEEVLTTASRDTLRKQAEWLRKNSKINVVLEGHADERGTREYNLALGERRANAAKDYLMTYGISGNRISVISYGKERPVDSGSNPLAWSKNRRSVTVKAN